MWNAPMTPLEAPSLTDQVYRRLLEAIDPSITGRVLAAAPYKAEHAARSHALDAGRTIEVRLKAMNEAA